MKLRYRSIALIVVALLAITSCNSSVNNNTNKESENPVTEDLFAWLIGEWHIQKPDYEMFETWEYGNDNSLHAYSYVLVDSDTVFSEIVDISKIDDDWYMSVRVSDHNNNEKVMFKLVSFDKKKLIFENKEHDFPQRIGYEYVSENQIYAYIEGVTDGEDRKETFEFEKLK